MYVIVNGSKVVIFYLNLFSISLPLIMTIEDIYKKFPNEDSCIRFLEKLKWNGEPECPYCLSNSQTPIKDNRYHCNTCNISYRVTVNTAMHKTKVDLQKWFYLIHLILGTNMSISLRNLGNELGVTKDTALRMSNKIKESVVKQDVLIQKIYNYERE